MSKADVINFLLHLGQFLLTVVVYGWPVATIGMWFRWWYLLKNDFQDKVDSAFFIAILMTGILIVAGGWLFWNSLPDTRPVVNINAR